MNSSGMRKLGWTDSVLLPEVEAGGSRGAPSAMCHMYAVDRPKHMVDFRLLAIDPLPQFA